MIRTVRIIEPLTLDLPNHSLILSAEDDNGPLTVRVGLMAWEVLQLAFPYLDDEDRRDAALFEIEQLAATHLSTIGSDRHIIVTDEEVTAMAEMREAGNRLH